MVYYQTIILISMEGDFGVMNTWGFAVAGCVAGAAVAVAVAAATGNEVLFYMIAKQCQTYAVAVFKRTYPQQCSSFNGAVTYASVGRTKAHRA